ncbi:UNVERIFIED_CONTAM: AraC family transcriptional regulator [Mumia flava]
MHDFHQLLYTPLGHAVIQAGDASHHLSRSVALWLPAGTWHSARFDADSLVAGIGFDADRFDPPAAGPALVPVSDHGRSLLLARLRTQADDTAPSPELYAALTASTLTLPLPEPRSPAATAVAAALVAGPADRRTAEQWAEAHFVSSTTLRRAFVTETGLTFSEWRTRARLNASVELLAGGQMVSAVAHRIGFTSVNGFILAFRRHFGQTPKAFAAQRLLV